MPRIHRQLLSASVLTLSGLLWAVPAAAQADDKEAEAAIKAALKPVAGAHKQQLNGVTAEVSAQLKAQGKAVSSGASAPSAGLEALAAAADQVHDALGAFSNILLLVSVQDQLEGIVQAFGAVPAGALVGTGGTLDKTLAKLDKQYAAALAKGRKALAALAKVLSKQSFPVAVRGTQAPLLAVAPGIAEPVGGRGDGAAPPFAPSPVLLRAVVGSSDADVPGDGSLRLSGALHMIGEPVSIMGRGPEGATFGPLEIAPDPGNPALDTYEAEVLGLAEGNWCVQVSQAGTLEADFIGVPGAPDPGTDDETAKDIAKSVKATWNELVKLHAKDVNAQVKEFGERLKDVQADIEAGGDVPAELEDAFDAVSLFQRLLHEITNDEVGAIAAAAFGQSLDGLDQLVPDLLVGSGLTSDKSVAKIEKRLATAAAKAGKTAQKLVGFLEKSTDWRLAVELQTLRFVPVAPVKGPELPLLPWPLRVVAAMGASAQSVAGDGVLWLRLTSDPALGADVTLMLHGPGGFTSQHVFPAGGAADLRFPESGPGNLPEGNYLIVLSQGAVHSSASVAVPGQP